MENQSAWGRGRLEGPVRVPVALEGHEQRAVF